MRRNLVLAVVLIFQVVFQTEAITGIEGNPVKITCSHSYADTNVKYFCRDPCDNADVLIKSNGHQTGKYRIEDKGNTFDVTISNLEKKDAGIYWCGIERVGADTYNKVILTVEKKTLENNPGVSPSKTIMYVGICLAVAVVVLATVLLFFYRYRKRNGKENNGTEYATHFMMKKAQYANTTSPVSEEGGDSKTQSSDVCYSTVSFNKNPTCSSLPPPTEYTTYSSVKPK
ncbi:CMRF35-like molecule 7 [Cyprinodon tularosa]|uniref:CMRF35-like molecule 7 n=1 Tax=Cyprinodon tularosa TaxID=77115 RepID=UPI0018E22195|nr:CMRF35-like molecule 7 [Cyprinodon tularosa]